MSHAESDEVGKLSKKEKRKRRQKSSTSDLETSIDKSIISTETPKSNRDKKKQKTIEFEESTEQTSANMAEKDQDISKQLKEINKKTRKCYHKR